MKKKIIYGIITGVIISIMILSIYFIDLDIKKSNKVQFEWLTSGPFSVQNYQHKLGENIFIVADGIAPNEKGTIRVLTPKNIEYVSYPFDGSVKPNFNVYFKPDTIARKDRCSPEDFIGVWTMKFDGVPYPPIQFEFINEYIIGAENDITDLCQYVK
jgi:hypothetical protein